MSSIAGCCIYLGRSRGALNGYQATRDWCARHKLHALSARADYNLACVHYLRGEYATALLLYRQSRQRCEEAGEAYHSALCDLDESEILLDLDLVTQAGHLAEQAAIAFEQLGLNYERAKATLNHAVAYFRRGDLTSANKLFRDARKGFSREDNRYWRAILDLYQSIVCEHEGKSVEARRFAERALGVLAHSPLTGKLAYCHGLLAHLKLRAGELEEAAVQLREMGKRLPSPALRFHFHFLRGRLHEEKGACENALQEYAAAIREMDERRRALWMEELKISFLHDKAEIYERAVRLSLKLQPDGRDAFLWVQRAKSASLAERLYAEPPDEPRRNLTADSRRLELAVGASRAPTSEALRGLRVRIKESEEQLMRLDGAGLPTHEFLPLELIQQTLSHDATRVEIFPLDDQLNLWVLTRNNLHHVACEKLRGLHSSVRLLLFQLSKPAFRAEYAAHATEAHLRAL